MKRFIVIVIISLGIALQASTCRDKDGHFSLRIRNDSDKDIRISISNTDLDTMVNCQLGFSLIEANSFIENTLTRNSWEDYFLENTGLFFIIDADVFENNECDSIRKNNLILKRYALTKYDLEKMNWTITYP